jgi:hypothetical protein
MALMLEITKADGSVARTPLESQATKVGAWPGGKVRVIDTATGKAPANLTAKRVGDSLIVENLPDGKTVEITKFYTDCSPAAPCALVIDPANATEAVTITQTTPPIATLGENQALMYGPTSSSGAAAAAPAGGLSTGAVLAGLALVGVAAAAGGGGGGGSKTPADTTPPDAPVVNTVAGDGVVDADEAAAGVAVSGTAEAGSTVTVTWGSTVKTATADAGGNWSVNFAQAELPADGPSTISVTARDAAGNVSSATEQAVTIDTAGADTTPPEAPIIAAVAGDDIVNAAEAADPVVVSGTAEAGSTVTVTWGSAVETATADESGNWSVTFAPGDLPADGATTISATATNAAGNESATGTRDVSVDTAAPAAPTAVVGPDGSVTGIAEPGSTVTIGSETAAADETTGAYTFAAGTVASGATAMVTATDAGGNVSDETEVTADTYELGTASDDIIVAGAAAFVDGGDGNDVLIGGAGGSVRNYQFEYWNTGGGGFVEGDPNYAVFGPAALNGWTVGSDPGSIIADPDGAAVEQLTGGPMELVSNQFGPEGYPDDTGGGGHYYWETVFDEGTGGSSISQSVHTRAGETYTLSIQMNGFDGDSSLVILWGGVEIWRHDGLTDESSGQEPQITNLSDSRQLWTWTVQGSLDSTTTELEIRAYEEALGDGVGRRIDSITLDAVVADGAETLVGGGGSDLLFGQAGDDILYGGAFGDTAATTDGVTDGFVYSLRADNGNDTIKDFEVGVDRIFLVDALDTYTADSLLPGDGSGGTTTNADDNLTFQDFFIDDSASQHITISDDGNGWLKLEFFGQTGTGTPMSVGSVVLEGVNAADYTTVESLFAGANPILSATMDGFHANLL